MTTWSEALPVVVTAVALVLVPGVVVGLVMGLRLPLVLGVAPLLSSTVVALAELANGVGLALFGPVLVAVCLAVLLGLGLLCRRLLGAHRAPRDLRTLGVWLAATVIGATLGIWGYVAGVGLADEFAQAPDVPYHANHIAGGVQTGIMNPFTFADLGGLTPDSTGFYPSLWHGFAVLIVQLTGCSVPVAINAMSVACLVTLSATTVLLANVLFGLRTSISVWSAIFSSAFVGFPTFTFTWGGILPNIFALTLLPAFLALIYLGLGRLLSEPDRQRGRWWARRGRHRPLGPGPASEPTEPPRPTNGADRAADDQETNRAVTTTVPTRSGTTPTLPAPLLDLSTVTLCRPGQLWVLLLAALPTMALAHPNLLLASALLFAVTLIATVLPWASTGAPPSKRVALRALAALTTLLIVLAFGQRSLSNLSTGWPRIETVPQAVGEVLTNATATPWVHWPFMAITPLVIGGALVAARQGRTHLALWYAVWVLLYAATQSETPTVRALTNIWYNDRHRVAAVAIIVSMQLATLAAVAGTDWLAALATRVADRMHRSGTPSRTRRWPTAGALVAGVAVFLSLSGWADSSVRSYVLTTTFPVGNDNNRNALITRDEQAFFSTLGTYVPTGQRVVNDPGNGSSLIFALSGVALTAYSTVAPRNADVAFLGQNIDRIGVDPRVCQAAQRLNARFVVTSGPLEFPSDRNLAWASVGRVKASPNFTVVANKTQSTLFRITACGWS